MVFPFFLSEYIANGKKNERALYQGVLAARAFCAVVIYTLVETAKLNKIDPQAGLSHVIKKIADYPTKKIDDFLPWNFELAR